MIIIIVVFAHKSHFQAFICPCEIVICHPNISLMVHTKFVLGFVSLAGVAPIARVWILAECRCHLLIPPSWIISFHWDSAVFSAVFFFPPSSLKSHSLLRGAQTNQEL